MLVTLCIRNLAVVQCIDIQFSAGFQVFTGETGAGKSIIMDALALISGARASTDCIRHGCSKAEVEALFELHPEHPIWTTLQTLGVEAPSAEQLVIRREINDQGKSHARINGQLVNVTMLRKIGEQLIHIHGQHDHHRLLRTSHHLMLLDKYGEPLIGPLKQKYEQKYAEYVEVDKHCRRLQKTSQETYQLLDMYQFQKKEIEQAMLKPGEDALLNEQRTKLGQSEKRMEVIHHCYELLAEQGGVDMIRTVMSRLETIVPYDCKTLQPIVEQLRAAFYQLEDSAFQIRSYKENIEFQPDLLDEIQQRLSVIAGLRRKYGSNVDEILQYYRKICDEIDQMQYKDEHIEQLSTKRMLLREQLLQLAQKLRAVRQKCAQQLVVQMQQQLKELQMERMTLSIQFNAVDEHTDEGRSITIQRNGIDQIEFFISSNVGEPLKPLHKISSGGELSRIMLVLQSIFSQHDQTPILIFDEVDTGVSGRAAQSIAEKLLHLASTCQVFAVTHLPQVACMAHEQYLIEKKVHIDRTISQVTLLDEEGRVKELARMLGGVEITQKTLHHASEMLKLAGTKKRGVRQMA